MGAGASTEGLAPLLLEARLRGDAARWHTGDSMALYRQPRLVIPRQHAGGQNTSVESEEGADEEGVEDAEEEQDTHVHYHCHSCRADFSIPVEVVAENGGVPECTQCTSGFVEETTRPRRSRRLHRRAELFRRQPGGLPSLEEIDAVLSELRLLQRALTTHGTLLNEALERSEQENKPRPTSEAAIEALSEVNVNRENPSLLHLPGDFCAEKTATAMPCAHVFHRSCISQWLRISDSCPICRCTAGDNPEGVQQEDTLEESESFLESGILAAPSPSPRSVALSYQRRNIEESAA